MDEVKVINGHSYTFWNMPELNTYEEIPEKLKNDVEGMVLKWLQDKEKIFEPMLEIDFKDTEGEWVKTLLFHRSEIHIKETANSWSCWHIASNLEWPHLFSCKMKSQFGINESYEDLVMPNEIKTFNYSGNEYSCYSKETKEPSLTRYQILLENHEKINST